MPRKKIYAESTTATSEAQKAAARAYYQRKKAAGDPAQKVLSITMRPDEYDEARAILVAHGLTPLQAWRKLMAELAAEPIPEALAPIAGTEPNPSDRPTDDETPNG